MGSSQATNRPTSQGVKVYSIGHSDHTIEAFLDLLRRYQINVVVDVRSQPHSRWVPQFNRESLVTDLEAAGLGYVFLGDSLGGRPGNRALYEPGQERPDYEQLTRTSAYQAGIEQLVTMAAGERLAIMCAEGDHRKCHRAKLITPTLLESRARVFHIQPDGTLIEAHPEPQQLAMF